MILISKTKKKEPLVSIITVTLNSEKHLEETLKNDTLGERGKKLSSGQIKRIGIARAIYKKNAKILILEKEKL